MNKYLVKIWAEEKVWNLRSIWVEADSFTDICNMNSQDFAESIHEFDEILDQDYGDEETWDIASVELCDEHPDNITPSDEKPDVENIDPNAGRGK